MGYLTLDEIKDIELDLLCKFDIFCKQHNLTYSLAYGTLLGAIRHKDFIPWDDDIDVMMPRKDYEKLFELLDNGEVVADYIKHLTNSMPGYYYHFGKLYNDKTVARMENNVTEHGIWLDVFPVDNVPNSHFSAKIFHIKARMMRNMIIAGTTDFSDKKNKKYRTKKFLKFLTDVVGIDKISQKLNLYVQKNNKKTMNNVSIVHGQYDTNADLPYSTYFPTILKPFRGKQFPVSNGWDTILKGMYGDYMVIPDKDHQQTHYLKAFYKE